MIGEGFFAPTPRDREITPLELFARRVTTANAAILVIPSVTVPDGRILALQSVAARGLGGGAQVCVRLSVAILQPDLAVDAGLMQVLAENDPVAGAATLATNWSGLIYVPPQGLVLVLGVFDVAVAVNTVELSVVGMLVIRGNVAI